MIRARSAPWALAMAALMAVGCEGATTATGPTRAALVPTSPLSRTREEPFRAAQIPREPRREWTPPTVVQWTLRNGMPVYFLPRRGSGLVSFEYINRRAGNRDNRTGPTLPWIFALMLGRGTLSRPSTRHADELASFGAELSTRCYASGLYTSVSVEPRSAARAATLLADAIVAPDLSESEFRRARERLFAARMSFSGSVAAHEIALWALFEPTHALARPEAGTASEINAVTHAELLSFARQRIVPAHSGLSVAGDIDEATLRAALDESFGRWTVEGSTAIDRAPRHTPPPRRARAWTVYDRDLAEDNAEVLVAYPLPALLDQDFAPALLLDYIVGAASGRINRTLREQQNITYGAHSLLNINLQGGFGIASTTVREELVPEAIDGIFDGIERLRRRPPSRAELEAARERARGDFFAGFESVSNLAEIGATLFAYELGTDSWTRHLTAIDAVTPAAVQHVALEYLSPDRVAVAIIGDAAAFARPLVTVARTNLVFVTHRP
ncbi:MAG: insulinase family protein [Myxococcales bacterium]|nr:insulinase family protein [Myxococcales bacterium]